ncbi:cupredoxin domain-containing protein [Rhodobacter ferrooxidans]|uniref:Blue (Type 1) copper domain protein n=1 Tax=Rhodobacter ferrooxidans TaxID=371731 RepID=C8RYR9_9RHOB|nr:cupredoxin family protein [Rhodobacter sp. SW2]EEW26257.1 blue (type 1) copper domain protein [Rhodobacter sp. SW2]
MRKALMAAVVICGALAGPVWSHGEAMAIGEAAEATAATRTIEITMGETADGQMVFTPATLEFAAGETVRLALHNTGAQEHEFIMGTPAEITEHKAMMEAMPDMVHTEANTLRLAPGASGEIVWTFANAGVFEFACLIPGHYEGGMHGPLTVK